MRFQFPSSAVPILKDPRRFARLRTHFLIELSGKYSVTLYELLESVANKDVPEFRASVDELRQWLKVPEGKLLRWQDLRRYVLEPAVRQINDNPTGAGFQVRMKVDKESRAITGVVFEVSKTKERQAIDAKLKDQEKQLSLFDVRLKTATYEKAKALHRGGIFTRSKPSGRNGAASKKTGPLRTRTPLSLASASSVVLPLTGVSLLPCPLPRFCTLSGCDWKLSFCGEEIRCTFVSAPRV